MSARPTQDYGSDGFADDDTIEMVFTPEQMQLLSAAQSTVPATSGASAGVTAREVTAVNASRRWPLAQSVAILGVAVALMGLSSAVHRAVVQLAHGSSGLAHGSSGQPTSPPELQTVPVPRTAPLASAVAVQTAISLMPVAAAAVTEAAAAEPSGAKAVAPLLTSNPVRVRNPFDRSEVFEFPPGTSRQEARQEMAEMLLERAHGRRPASRR